MKNNNSKTLQSRYTKLTISSFLFELSFYSKLKFNSIFRTHMLVIFLAGFSFINNYNAQTTIYSTNFGTVANVNPAGWTFNGANMNISTNTSSSGYAGASGGAYLGEGNSVAFVNTSGTSEPSSQIGASDATLLISSIGYSTVVVSFGMRKSSAGYNSNATYAFEWSADGITYNTISYTEATAGGWGLASGTGLTLPASAGNQPTLYLRWSFNRTGTASNFKIDDVIITGNNNVTNSAPTIIMDVINTTNYLDGGVTVSPVSPYITSSVINDPTDPAKTLGFNFIVNDAQTSATNLTVTAVCSNTTIISNSNITISGSGSLRNVKITPTSVGYTSVTLNVTDGLLNSSYALYVASSAAAATPSNTVWHTGMSDASDAISIDDNYYITGDDEMDILNVYSRTQSGLPLASFDYTLLLGLDLSKPEVDLEASTTSPTANNKKYWLGSMSTGGSSFTVRPNRDRLFATTISGTGASTTFSVNGYYSNLRARLLLWGDANGYNFSASAAAGVDSKSVSGFAAEGMVFGPDNTTLYIGLRAPLVPTVNRTKAVIAPILNFETWFNNGSPSGNPTFGAPIELNLGGRGFRDIIRLTNGTYIIVAGNAAGSPITSAIYKWTGNAADAPILVPTSADAILNLEGVMEVNTSGLLSMNQLQVLSDGGTDDLYNDGTAAKDFTDLNLRKFRLDNLNAIDLCFPLSTAISTSSLTICSGQTTTLNATGATTYTWSGGTHNTTYSVSPSTNTTYSVFGNDLYGCGGTAMITITVNPTPTVIAIASNTAICLNDTLTLSVTGANTYTWSGGENNSSFTLTPQSSSNYTVFGTDLNRCTNSSMITVNINPVPVITASANNLVICNNESTTITLSGANTYTWTDNSNNSSYTVTPNLTTTYNVIGTDVNGCKGNSAITITVNPTPTVQISASQLAICASETATLNASGASTYTWTDNSTSSTYTVSPTNSSNYSVTGTDINGCQGNSSITVTVNPVPTISISASNSVICSGNSSLLTASGASTYSWTNGPNTSTYSVTPATTANYTVAGTDVNNCSNTSIITLSVNTTPIVTVTATSNTICSGQSTTLTANGATTYSWVSSGSALTTETVSPTVNTTYSITGETNGCIGNSSIQITVNQLPSISVSSSNTLICTGEAVILTANTNASTYSWSNGASSMSISVTPTATTVYSVNVNDGLCSSNAAFTQSVSACTAMSELETVNSINLYPNPFNNSFEVKMNNDFSENKNKDISIYTILGERVHFEKATSNELTIKTDNWKNGAYFIRINDKVYKIIKQD